MTGVVLEVNKDGCLVIDRNGIVHKVRISGKVKVGETVPIPQRSIRPMMFSFAAAAVILVVLGLPYVYSKVIDTKQNGTNIEIAGAEYETEEDGPIPLSEGPEHLEENWVFRVCVAGAAGATVGIIYYWQKKSKPSQ